MTNSKITRKELFQRIATVMYDDEEVVAMCEKYIDQLSQPRKKKINTAAIEFAESVYQTMRMVDTPEDGFTSAALAEMMESSTQKVGAALRRLTAEGRVERHEGGKVLVYTLAEE